MKIFLRNLAVGLGITTVGALWMISPLITQTHIPVYHWEGPASAIFIPCILDFCIIWFVLTTILLLAHGPGRIGVMVWSGIVAALPWIVLMDAGYIAERPVPHTLQYLVLSISFAVWLIFLLSWRRYFQSAFQRVQHFLSTAFAFVALVGLVFLCQSIWFAWQARALNAAVPLHVRRSAVAPPAKPSVLWIIFDELSYRQLYEHRYPGLQLPAFDALAAESTVFTRAIPAGNMTDIVIPGLLTGKPIDGIRPSIDGRRLSIHQSGSDAWQQFDQHQTVFQDAIDSGYNTAVAGWANPYCRILPDVLDRCFWTYHDIGQNFMIPNQSIAANMLAPLIHFTGSEHSPLNWLRPRHRDELWVTAPHSTDYRQIVAAGEGLLEDTSNNFIFLHLPVPHPEGFYIRATNQFSTKPTSYVDNLALADRCLAHIRSILEGTGKWDSTAVVVMGDHSWRTRKWVTTRFWTREDQIASEGGKFDDRPAYIVKLPGQKTAAQISVPFAAVNTRGLLNGIMTHSIQTQDDLSNWVRSRNFAQ